jgi:sporulation integral membrane protein YtvI
LSPSMEKTVHILLKIIMLLIAGAGLYFFAHYLWPLLIVMLVTSIKAVLPFLLAFIAAVLLNPIIVFLEERFHLPRTPGTLLTLAIFLVLLGVIFYLLISNMIQELIDLSQTLGTLSYDLSSWNLNLFLDKFQSFLSRLNLPPDFIQEMGHELLRSINVLKNIVTILSSQLFHLVTALPQYFILLVVTIIATFFFTRDFEIITDNILKWIPDKWQAGAFRIGRGLERALFGYLKAQLLLVSVTGLLSAIGLTLLGVKYANLLALLMAILDLIPVVGPGTIYMPWALWMICTGDIKFGVEILIVYGIVIIVRQIMEPKVLGNNIGLHPLTTLMALYIGISLLGFWGLIIGPVTVIVYKAFIND